MNSVVIAVNNNKNSFSPVLITLARPFSLRRPESGPITGFVILLWNSPTPFYASAFPTLPRTLLTLISVQSACWKKLRFPFHLHSRSNTIGLPESNVHYAGKKHKKSNWAIIVLVPVVPESSCRTLEELLSLPGS